MTLMVRDEADVIGSMIEHSLAQGVDTLIVTDNGSLDGTVEILESFGDAIDLRHDPVQRKQQFSVVTGMARDAATQYGADWVINADADEFWLPTAGGATLREVFELLPRELATFRVDVVDMTGAPAQRGTGLQRLVYRDTRPVERLNELGIHAHSTPDAVHVGSAEIEVAQGNHFVNLEQNGEVPNGLGVEVLHFPWRSWEQFEGKVAKAGQAYAANPELQPSPNHHGMREYYRWLAGALQAYYVIRHPDAEELAAGIRDGVFVEETRIASTVPSAVPDVPLSDDALIAGRRFGPVLAASEAQSIGELRAKDARIAELLRNVDEGKQRIDGLIDEVREAGDRIGALQLELNMLPTRRIKRAAGRVVDRVRKH
ncbi:glycosyltransferase family 2 protein [Leifsonia poae]|nr:glycosyltransferase family 2 protein [Leifsonia poae]